MYMTTSGCCGLEVRLKLSGFSSHELSVWFIHYGFFFGGGLFLLYFLETRASLCSSGSLRWAHDDHPAS